MKVMRKIIEIDEERCDGCGQCVPGCAEGALEIIDGKAVVVSEGRIEVSYSGVSNEPAPTMPRHFGHNPRT